jgi:hypothetical protein
VENPLQFNRDAFCALMTNRRHTEGHWSIYRSSNVFSFAKWIKLIINLKIFNTLHILRKILVKWIE